MFPKDNKRAVLSYTILIRNNKTNKHSCIRFDEESIKSEQQLLNLIIKLLEEWKKLNIKKY